MASEGGHPSERSQALGLLNLADLGEEASTTLTISSLRDSSNVNQYFYHFLDVVTRISSKEDKKHRKMETKTERDLKNLIDQCLSVKPNDEQISNPLNEFFKDERNMTTNLLRIIQSDIESLHLEGSKVNYL